MSNAKQDTSLLFGVIPSFLRKPEQVAHWDHGRESHTFTLLRKPNNLDEMNNYEGDLAVWRDNGTLTYVMPRRSEGLPAENERDNKRHLYLSYCDKYPGLSLHIFGKTDCAVAETAVFFMELEEPSESSSFLEINCDDSILDFRSAPSQWLTRIFEKAPLRAVEFSGIKLSVEQSIVLATRPHSTKLSLCGCLFEDNGTAFVDGLQQRQIPFGSLTLEETVDDYTGFNNENLRRLLQIDAIKHLSLPCLHDDDLALLPFSARTECLDYIIPSSALSEADLASLNIVTDKLSLTIFHGMNTFPSELMVSFFRRVAELGHFVELTVKVLISGVHIDIPNCFVQELIRAVHANCNLNFLHLSDGGEVLKWTPHVKTMLEGIQDHKGLQTFIINVSDSAFGPDFSYLKQLLSRNRNITIADEHGRIYSDGSSIDELYSLNRFYRGSAELLIQPPLERPSLVATALVQRASNDYQRTALLFADHGDALCELVQFARLDELADEDIPPSRAIRSNNRKRRRSAD